MRDQERLTRAVYIDSIVRNLPVDIQVGRLEGYREILVIHGYTEGEVAILVEQAVTYATSAVTIGSPIPGINDSTCELYPKTTT